MARKNYSNIAIIRLSSLGDIIHTLPALFQLTQHFPRARVNWIVEPAGAELLKNFSGIHRIVTFDVKSPDFWQKPRYLKSFLRENRNRYDLIIDFQGLIKSALLARLLRGGRGTTLGFARPNLRETQAAWCYQHQIPPLPSTLHVIRKNLALLGFLNIRSSEIRYPLIPPDRTPRLREFFQSHRLESKGFLLYNLGAGFETKKLPLVTTLDLLERLKKRFPIILLWGNPREEKTADLLRSRTGVIKSPFWNFSELIWLIRQARILVTADTLALHLADMTQTPSVSYFGPTDPAVNGSLLPQSTSVVPPVSCRFCYRRKCDKMECMIRLRAAKLARTIANEYQKAGQPSH